MGANTRARLGFLAAFWMPGAVWADDGSCSAWTAASQGETLDRTGLTEVSGLAASRQDPGLLWLHNDKGAGAELVGAGVDGTDRGTVTVVGAVAEDWEDMAVGPCPDGATRDGAPACSCLWVADIGDNDAERDAVALYALVEPDAGDADTVRQATLAAEVWFTYAGGPTDAETLLVHPVTGEALVITRTDPVEVYAFPTAPPSGGTAEAPLELERIAKFDLDDIDANADEFTAGAVSPHGLRVALRTNHDLFLLVIDDDDSLAETFEDLDDADDDDLEDALVALPAPPGGEGEALDFAADGQRLYLVSEGIQASVWSVNCVSFTSDGDDSDPLVDCNAVEDTGTPPIDDGCGCATGGSTGAWWLLGLLVLRRRRR